METRVEHEAPTSWHATLVLALITIAGAVLRIFDLGDKSLWLDEANIYWISQGSLSEVLGQNIRGNSAPPLFTWLISFLAPISSSEAALRALPCAAGIALIPAVYSLTRRYGGYHVALASAALVAVSPTQVLYSQQLREYSLAALLGTLLVHAAQAFLDHPGRREALALGTVTVISLFTQYGLGLLVAALALFTAFRLAHTRQPASAWRRWALVHGAGLLSVVALLRLGLVQQLADGKGGVTKDIAYLARGFWTPGTQSAISFVLERLGGLVDFTFPGTAFAFLVLLGGFQAIRDPRARAAGTLFATVLAVAVSASLLHAYPFGGMRQDIFLTPMLYVLAALGFSVLWTEPLRWQPQAAAAGLVLAGTGLLGVRNHYWSEGEEPMRPLLAEYLAARQPGDELYVSARAGPAFRYYTRGMPLEGHEGVRIRRADPGPAIAQLDSLVRRPGRLWLLFSDVPYEQAGLILRRLPPGTQLDTVRVRGRSALLVEDSLP